MKKLSDLFKKEGRRDDEDPQEPKRGGGIVPALAAISVVGSAGALIAAGLQHGMQGYDARQAREKKLQEQRKKRENRQNKGPKGPRR